jgi:hypothetical protein
MCKRTAVMCVLFATIIVIASSTAACVAAGILLIVEIFVILRVC